jgi:hypothetical protein
MVAAKAAPAPLLPHSTHEAAVAQGVGERTVGSVSVLLVLVLVLFPLLVTLPLLLLLPLEMLLLPVAPTSELAEKNTSGRPLCKRCKASASSGDGWHAAVSSAWLEASTELRLRCGTPPDPPLSPSTLPAPPVVASERKRCRGGRGTRRAAAAFAASARSEASFALRNTSSGIGAVEPVTPSAAAAAGADVELWKYASPPSTVPSPGPRDPSRRLPPPAGETGNEEGCCGCKSESSDETVPMLRASDQLLDECDELRDRLVPMLKCLLPKLPPPPLLLLLENTGKAPTTLPRRFWSLSAASAGAAPSPKLTRLLLKR